MFVKINSPPSPVEPRFPHPHFSRCFSFNVSHFSLASTCSTMKLRLAHPRFSLALTSSDIKPRFRSSFNFSKMKEPCNLFLSIWRWSTLHRNRMALLRITSVAYMIYLAGEQLRSRAFTMYCLGRLRVHIELASNSGQVVRPTSPSESTRAPSAMLAIASWAPNHI